MKSVLALTTILILLTSCSAPPTQPMTAPVPTLAHMPNPAPAYCEQQGNELEIRTAADGSQSGVCIVADGIERSADERSHAHPWWTGCNRWEREHSDDIPPYR